jgi:hypothetical protein
MKAKKETNTRLCAIRDSLSAKMKENSRMQSDLKCQIDLLTAFEFTDEINGRQNTINELEATYEEYKELRDIILTRIKK